MTNGAWERTLVYGFGQQFSESQSSGVIYVLGDQVGSPNYVTNASGALLNRMKNLPFGERMLDASPSAPKSLRRFTNHEEDPDSNAIYMQAREYLAAYGKFAQVDPAYDQTKDDPESWNLYNYVTNNPVTHMDPDGRQVKKSAAEWHQEHWNISVDNIFGDADAFMFSLERGADPFGPGTVMIRLTRENAGYTFVGTAIQEQSPSAETNGNYGIDLFKSALSDLASPNKNMMISSNGFEFLLNYEKFKSNAYQDAAGYFTIGYGHKIKRGESYFLQTITETQGRGLALHDLNPFMKSLRSRLTKSVSQNQFDALSIFGFNCPSGIRSRSSIMFKINHGQNVGLSDFTAYDKARNVQTNKLFVVPGLLNRRRDEYEMYAFSDYIRNH